MTVSWTISVTSIVALVISLGTLAHTIWFVRKTDRFRHEMEESLARRSAMLADALELVAQLQTELAKHELERKPEVKQ